MKRAPPPQLHPRVRRAHQRPRLLPHVLIRVTDMTSPSASAPPPPPDPVYTFRPYAGEVTTVQYVTLPGRQPAIASG